MASAAQADPVLAKELHTLSAAKIIEKVFQLFPKDFDIVLSDLAKLANNEVFGTSFGADQSHSKAHWDLAGKIMKHTGNTKLST